jgi:hypothetical protein
LKKRENRTLKEEQLKVKEHKKKESIKVGQFENDEGS